MQTADGAGSTIILATDPDADRLALAERSPLTGRWKVFSGNEIGTLMSWWAFKNYKERNPGFDGEQLARWECSLVPRLHSPALYRTIAMKSWGVESGNIPFR